MKKYILMLSLVLVLALVVIGVGYGYWTETLDVNGTVSTTELSVKWLNNIPLTPNCNDFETSGNDFASVSPTWINNNRVDIAISNGYPGYSSRCYLDFENDGAILSALGRGLKVVGDDLTGCTPASGEIISGVTPTTLDCNEATIVFRDGIGGIFAPTQGGTDQVVVTVKGGALQNHTYHFHAQTCVSQTADPGTPVDCFNDAPINP